MDLRAQLVSIQVGKPHTYGFNGASNSLDRPWRSAFIKAAVSGPVWLRRTNLEGDAQANRRVHGGADKAVLAYAESHYPVWRSELAMPELPYGAFAENFTVRGLDEDSVCLGDVFAVGDQVHVQVSQPRQPCSNISHRWRLPELTQRVEDTGRTGWYLRVLAEGVVEAGQEMRLLQRPAPEWTVTRAARAMRRRREDPAEAVALAALPALSAAWRHTLSRTGVAV